MTETRVTNLMLIGRNQWVIDAAERELTSPTRAVFGAVTMAELEAVLTEHRIDHAFVGPGLDLDLRMDLIRRVFELSDFTTVHLKDFTHGPEGALPFVDAILTGLDALADR
jgi:hypothetical protein